MSDIYSIFSHYSKLSHDGKKFPKTYLVRDIVECLLSARAKALHEKEEHSLTYVPFFAGNHVFNSKGSIEPKSLITLIRAYSSAEINHNTINRTRQSVLSKLIQQASKC